MTFENTLTNVPYPYTKYIFIQNIRFLFNSNIRFFFKITLSFIPNLFIVTPVLLTLTLSLLAKNVMRSADQNCILAIFV